MALPDLTGQFIQDTYQRVLQVSSSGDMVDGTGSLFIPPTASYAISASHEIVKEISSSYADTASYAISASNGGIFIKTGSFYSTTNNLQITGSLKIQSGSITMEHPQALNWRGKNGRIYNKIDSNSSPGEGYYALQYFSNGGDGDFNIMHQFYTNKGGNNDTSVVEINRGGDLKVVGSIISSANISASGNIKFTTTENQTLSNIALYDTSSGELFYAPSSIFEGDDNSTNPNSTLSQELKPNLSVGGISTQDTFEQGSTIENLLRKMLITFKVSSLGTLTLKNGNSSVGLGIKEVNSSFTFDNVSISSNDNDPNSNYPLALSFQSFGIPAGDFNETFNDTPLTSNDNFSFPSKTVDVLSITGKSKQVSFTFKAKDPDSDQILNKSTSATFIYPMYWGHSSEDYFSTGNVEDILPKQLSTIFSSKSIHFNFTNEYIYFCVPETYGTLKKVEDGNSFNVTDSFVKITRPQAGSAGWNGVSYNIYKTNLTSVNNQTFKFYL